MKNPINKGRVRRVFSVLVVLLLVSALLVGTGSATEETTFSVSTDEELANAISQATDKTIIRLSEGTFILPENKLSKSFITIIGAGKDKTNISTGTSNSISLTGNNLSIKDLTIKGSGKFTNPNGVAALSGSNATFENVIFTDGGHDTWASTISVSINNDANLLTFENCEFYNAFRGIQFWCLKGTVIINNSIIDPICYTFNADDGTGNLLVKNTALKGWTSYTTSVNSVTFENCIFEKSTKSGSYGYNTIVPYTQTIIKDSTFNENSLKIYTSEDPDGFWNIENSKVVNDEGKQSTLSLSSFLDNEGKEEYATVSIDSTKDTNEKYISGTFVGTESSISKIKEDIATGYLLIQSSSEWTIEKFDLEIPEKVSPETEVTFIVSLSKVDNCVWTIDGEIVAESEIPSLKYTFTGTPSEQTREIGVTVTVAGNELPKLVKTIIVEKKIDASLSPEIGADVKVEGDKVTISTETSENPTITVDESNFENAEEVTIDTSTTSIIVKYDEESETKIENADNSEKAYVGNVDTITIVDKTSNTEIVMNYESPVEVKTNATTGETSISGTPATVVAKYPDVDMPVNSDVIDTATYGLELNLKPEEAVKGVTLPTISPVFDEMLAKTNADKYGVKPFAMITASMPNNVDIKDINSKLNEITLTFTVPAAVYAKKDEIYVLHIKSDGSTETLKAEKWIPSGNNYQFSVTGTSFSSYIAVLGEPKVSSDSGSTHSSGSSVWLTEPATQTPTPTPTETATPTDTVPTDIPVTQPTATPSTPGFGIIAILSGLGAVAVLRRK